MSRFPSLVRRRRPKIGINIVPLVDVLIVLIFFFLITMQFRNLKMMDITPPSVETAGKSSLSDNIIIGVDKTGELFLNNEPVELEVLEERLVATGRSAPATSVFVLADEESSLKYTTAIIDTSRKAGLEQIRLQVK